MRKHSKSKQNNTFYPINGYPGYFISKLTTDVLCTNEAFPVILQQIPNSLGENNYFVVVLSDGKNHFIHRLMAKTFLPDEKEHVNHIDGNKQNNQLSNLEWATPKENAQHAILTGLTDQTVLQKEVHQYDLAGKYLQSFASIVIAENMTTVAKQNISKTALGKRHQAGGYQWRYTKLDQIAPANPNRKKQIKCMKVSSSTTTVEVYPTGQDVYTEVCALVNCLRSKLIRKFKIDGTVIFENGFRIEKIYHN